MEPGRRLVGLASGHSHRGLCQPSLEQKSARLVPGRPSLWPWERRPVHRAAAAGSPCGREEGSPRRGQAGHCHLAAHPRVPPVWLVPAGLGWRPDLFSFSIPFIAQTTSGPQKTKPLSSADLSSLASIVCRLLILASDHFHPHPPPQRETHTKNSAWKGGGVCGQSSHSHPAASGSGRGLQ